ncbi:MAG: NupC/NupG family nucleoside CNT transporter [Planctomycetota bacterium]|jgi:CNT family concentrative nucleoside transporter
MSRLVSLLGIAVILGILFALSRNRKAISWRLVITGLLIQATLGACFLYWDRGNLWLRSFGKGVENFLALSQDGTSFIWGPLADRETQGFIFATQVLPTLIFFSSFMTVLYHLGIMQKVVQGMAWVMARLMGTSGSESLSACGNIFVGQTEAPLMVRPYLPRMTLSEIHAIMTGGFCTIAGGVFVLYVGFRIDAGHLMVASVMAVPAGLICTKMLWPETEQSETMGKVVRTVETDASNVVEAAANGALVGLRLALNVGAMLIAFLGLVAVIDWLLAFIPWFGDEHLSLGMILGWLFYPIAMVMGVDNVTQMAELLGTKLVLTELVAYKELRDLVAAGEITARTKLIASFALCGFANLGSVAIQIGGLGAMAPDRKGDIARLALRAMFAGALATCMTACLAGVLASEVVG